MNGKCQFGNVDAIHKEFYVGRTDIFEELGYALSHGASAFLYGGPRVGKSAFIDEFIRRFAKKHTKTQVPIVLSFKGSHNFSYADTMPLADQLRRCLKRYKGRTIFIDELNSGVDPASNWEVSQQLDFVATLSQLMQEGVQFVLISQLSLPLLLYRMPQLESVFPRRGTLISIRIPPFTLDEMREFCSHSKAPARSLAEEIYDCTKGNAYKAGIILAGVNFLYGRDGISPKMDDVLRHNWTANRLKDHLFGLRRFEQEWNKVKNAPLEVEDEIRRFFADLGMRRKVCVVVDLDNQRLIIGKEYHSFQTSAILFCVLVLSLTVQDGGCGVMELRSRINAVLDNCKDGRLPKWFDVNKIVPMGEDGISSLKMSTTLQQFRRSIEQEGGFLAKNGIYECRIASKGPNKRMGEDAVPANWHDFLLLRWRYKSTECDVFPRKEFEDDFPQFTKIFLGA